MQKHERAVTRWQIKMGLDDFFLQQNDSVCAQVPYKGKKKKPTQLYQVATCSHFHLKIN